MPQAAAVRFRWNPKLALRNYAQTNGFIIICLTVGKLLNLENPKWAVPWLLGFLLCFNAFLLVVNLVQPLLRRVDIDAGREKVTVSRWLRPTRTFSLGSLSSGFRTNSVKGVKTERWVLVHDSHILAKVTPGIDGWLRKDLVRLDKHFRDEPSSYYK